MAEIVTPSIYFVSFIENGVLGMVKTLLRMHSNGMWL